MSDDTRDIDELIADGRTKIMARERRRETLGIVGGCVAVLLLWAAILGAAAGALFLLVRFLRFAWGG